MVQKSKYFNIGYIYIIYYHIMIQLVVPTYTHTAGFDRYIRATDLLLLCVYNIYIKPTLIFGTFVITYHRKTLRHKLYIR